ncbi:MAG: hypothetical protein ACN6OP_29715 [Pseudomonadales bacterium]
MAMRKREDEVFPNAAGIDVGASSHWVAVPRHAWKRDYGRRIAGHRESGGITTGA